MNTGSAHAVRVRELADLLTAEEMAALDGRASPAGVITDPSDVVGPTPG